MVEIIAKQITEIRKPPKELNIKNIVYYSEHYQKLKTLDGNTARLSKAKAFLKNNCIKWSKEHKNWVCYPIKRYNKSFYHIRWNKDLPNFKTGLPGEFECSCQFSQKVGQMCSHILALYLYLRMYNYNKKQKNMELFPKEIIENEEKIE